MHASNRATLALLRQEADILLRELRVHEIVSEYGTLTPTGSYFLDVMAYPDIDFCISQLSVEQLFSIGGRLAASPLVYEVVFQKSKDESLPGGLYLKPRIQYWQLGTTLEDRLLVAGRRGYPSTKWLRMLTRSSRS